MNKIKPLTSTADTRKLIGIEDLQNYLSVGRSTALKIGQESGARRKIGKRLLYDRAIIDKYVDNIGA